MNIMDKVDNIHFFQKTENQLYGNEDEKKRNMKKSKRYVYGI